LNKVWVRTLTHLASLTPLALIGWDYVGVDPIIRTGMGPK
jgi:hypothetical protein